MNFYSQDAANVVSLALEGIEATILAGDSYFAWLHFYDPHFPYSPPNQLARRFKGYNSVEKNVIRALTAQSNGNVTRDMFDWIVGQYSAEIENVTRELGYFFDRLESLSQPDTPLVIITADHGESFEHGVYFRHESSVYATVLSVPLIVSWPGHIIPGEVTEPVSLVDLLPSILELLDMTVPPGVQGESLVPLLRGESMVRDPVIFSSPTFRGKDQLQIIRKHDLEKVKARDDFLTVLQAPRTDLMPHREQTGILNGEWKLILTGGQPSELYNLDRDSLELNNLLKDNPQTADEMLLLLNDMHDGMPDNRVEGNVTAHGEEDRILRALGYLD